MSPREVSVVLCQLWTSFRPGRAPRLHGHSIHADASARDRFCGRPIPASQNRPEARLFPEGGPYRVEVPCGPRRRAPAFDLVHPGLPRLPLVDPDGFRSLLDHLIWDQVLDRSDGWWDEAVNSGFLRSRTPGTAVGAAGNMVRISGYWEFVRRIRAERGPHVVKLSPFNFPDPLPDYRDLRVFAFFAAPTPEALEDSLRVASVMEL